MYVGMYGYVDDEEFYSYVDELIAEGYSEYEAMAIAEEEFSEYIR